MKTSDEKNSAAISEIPRNSEEKVLSAALAKVGRDARFRDEFLDALRKAEMKAEAPATFREEVRRPLMFALFADAGYHNVTLENGLVFEVRPDSRIEQALLLSSEARPDHVWEPQTTRLLVTLGMETSHVIVGGAYIGDHVLLIARAMSESGMPGTVHAFEPMESAYRRLVRHLELNSIDNVLAHRLGLWDRSDAMLDLEGDMALAAAVSADEQAEVSEEAVRSVSIDDYVKDRQLSSVGLVMLDTEGGEEKALLGARDLIARSSSEAPHLVFEVHRNYVDWTNGLENTSIIELLTSNGYEVFAIRDFHDNHRMAGRPIEIVPVDSVYLEGPPHGFNVLATKDSHLAERLGLSVVRNVSPKLLIDKDPALHHPLDGLP